MKVFNLYGDNWDCPYHAHHGNEEWVIVRRGQPTLRTPEGEQVLEEGDVVCSPRGKDGAHQMFRA